MNAFRRILIPLAALLAVTVWSTAAFAAVAAYTKIKNTATLTYDGGFKDATAIVNVNLVAAAPTLTLTGGTKGYSLPNDPSIPDPLLIITNANGPASYHITATVGSSGGQVQMNNNSSGSVSDGGGIDVILGASVTTTAITNTNTLVIPAGQITGSGATLKVNGLGDGTLINFLGYSAIKISGAPTDNGNDTYTLTLDQNVSAPVGTPIFEQRTVNGITALPGSIQSLGADILVYARATAATPGVSPDTNSNWATNTWTSAAPTVIMQKFVRNLNSARNPSSGSCFTNKHPYNIHVNIPQTSDYFDTGCVTVNTGDTLEYLVLAGNSSATTDLLNSAIADAIPNSYVTFNFGAYGGSNQDVYYSADAKGLAANSFLLAAAGTGQASIAPWPIPAPPAGITLKVNVGTGANSTTKGTIANTGGGANNTLFIAYQVKVR